MVFRARKRLAPARGGPPSARRLPWGPSGPGVTVHREGVRAERAASEPLGAIPARPAGVRLEAARARQKGDSETAARLRPGETGRSLGASESVTDDSQRFNFSPPAANTCTHFPRNKLSSLESSLEEEKLRHHPSRQLSLNLLEVHRGTAYNARRCRPRLGGRGHIAAGGGIVCRRAALASRPSTFHSRRGSESGGGGVGGSDG